MNVEQKKAAGDLFGGHAKLYATARPVYPDDLFTYLVSLSENTDKVWDCATGTGQAAIALAKYFDQVYATDISAQQIETASQAAYIDYTVQSAEATTFEADTFDMICVAQALHWFDHDKFWIEIDRVLKPGGVFAAWGYDWTKIDFDIDFLLQDKLFAPLAGYWNPKAQLLWGGYDADKVKFPYIRIDAPSFNITLDWNLDQLFEYFLSWSAVQAYLNDNGTQMIEQAKTHVKTVWGDPNETKLITWPIHTLIGRKAKNKQ